jgi:hypothetical protein
MKNVIEHYWNGINDDTLKFVDSYTVREIAAIFNSHLFTDIVEKVCKENLTNY